MLLPLHICIWAADGYGEWVSYGCFIVTAFSMHYHFGVAGGLWDKLTSCPRGLDLSAQVVGAVFVSYGTSWGNGAFTSAVLAAGCFVMTLIWWKKTRHDGNRWIYSALLTLFASTGLILRGKVVAFVLSMFSGAVGVYVFSLRHEHRFAQAWSRVFFACWIVCVTRGSSI